MEFKKWDLRGNLIDEKDYLDLVIDVGWADEQQGDGPVNYVIHAAADLYTPFSKEERKANAEVIEDYIPEKEKKSSRDIQLISGYIKYFESLAQANIEKIKHNYLFKYLKKSKKLENLSHVQEEELLNFIKNTDIKEFKEIVNKVNGV